MADRASRWVVLTAVVGGLVVAACGTSSSGSAPPVATTPSSVAVAPSSTTAPVATLTITAAPAGCPTAATVGAALGITVAAPHGVAVSGGTSLPAGATSMVCDYSGTALNVIIESVQNIDPTAITLFSSRFPVPYASVSGVGDQARSFSQKLGAGKDNEGVVATKGSALVDITATATPASLTQIEALIKQLL